MTVLALTRSAWQGKLGFQLPWLALAPLLLIPVVGANPASMNNLLFAVEVLLLAAGVRRPIWIPAALLVSEMTHANFIHEFGGFQLSNRLLLSAISLPVLLPHIAARIDIGRKSRVTIALAIVFVAMTTTVNLTYSDDGYVLQFLRYILIGAYMLMLLPLTVRNREDLRDLCILLFVIASVSGLTGVFQHWSTSRGTPLWEVIPHIGTPGESFISWEERAVGLSENPIHIGNVLMVAGLFALGVVLFTPLSANAKRIIVVSLLIMCAASYFSYTRSWALAMGPALLTIALFYKGRYKKEFWMLVIVLAAGLWYWSDMKATRYSPGAEDSGSAEARPVLWTVGMSIAIDHPWLGVGHDSFLELSPEYAKTLDRGLVSSDSAKGVIGVYTPHNDLLNVWLSWGFFTLVIYVLLSIIIGKNFLEAYYTTADPLLKGLALGGLAAMVGFQFNSLFHNFFDSALTLWVLGGFSLVLLKLAPHMYVADEPPARKPPPPPPKLLLVRNEMGEWEQCAV